MTRAVFKLAWSLQTATMQPGKWQDEHRPLVDERDNVIGIVSAKLDAVTAFAASGVPQGGIELPGIRAGSFGQAQSAQHEG